MPKRRPFDSLWAVILLAVILRGGVMARKSGAFDDPDNYLPLARSVASGDGFMLKGRATAYRPPLYPLMLAALVSNTGEVSFPGIALLHLGLGAGTVWLTAKAAKGSGLANGRACFAAFVVACDPVLVWQSRSVMTETPTAFLLALGFAGLCRPGLRGAVLGGAAFGLAALCRPSLLAGTILTIVAAAVTRPGAAWRGEKLVLNGQIGSSGRTWFCCEWRWLSPGRRRLKHPLPPCGGGLGWGVFRRGWWRNNTAMNDQQAQDQVFITPGAASQRLARSGLMAVSVMVVLSPWMIRNFVKLGEPVWTTTHGGYTLALANNPVYYREVLHGGPGRVWSGRDQWLWWDSVNRETAGMSEPEADRYLRNQALRLARNQPADFARAILARLGHFWGVAPVESVYPAPARWATAFWTIPLFLALAVGLFQPGLWSWPRVAAPAAILGLTIVHAFYWTDLRMRAPIVPAIALVAAGASVPRRVFSRERKGKVPGSVA